MGGGERDDRRRGPGAAIAPKQWLGTEIGSCALQIDALQYPETHLSRTSPLSLSLNRLAVNLARAASTALRCSGVPALGSYTHTCRPMWPFSEVRRGCPSESLAGANFHIAGDASGGKYQPFSREEHLDSKNILLYSAGDVHKSRRHQRSSFYIKSTFIH